MKLKIGEEQVIVQGMRPEEGQWGPYQFATPYKIGDKIAVSVHVGEDSMKTYGDGKLWFVSEDQGETWQETSPDIIADCGLELPNGDKIIFPRVSAIELSDYRIPSLTELTPDVDFSKKAEEGTLPLQDGLTSWQGNILIRAYNADRLPDSLSAKKWYMIRKTAKGEVNEEYCELDWPYLTRVVFSGPGITSPYMKGIFQTGVPRIGPDGAIWITAFSGEGHINPKNKQYSPYYSAEDFPIMRLLFLMTVPFAGLCVPRGLVLPDMNGHPCICQGQPTWARPGLLLRNFHSPECFQVFVNWNAVSRFCALPVPACLLPLVQTMTAQSG